MRATGARGRIWLLDAVIAAAALSLYIARIRHMPDPAVARVSWWMLAIMFAAAEVFVVHFHLRRDVHSYSLSEVATTMGLALASPTALIVGQLVGTFLALTLHRKQSPMKLAFNISAFALEAMLVLTVFHAIPHGDSGFSMWMASFAACLVFVPVSNTLINTAVYLTGGGVEWRLWGRLLLVGWATTAMNVAIGLVVVELLQRRSHAVWLLGAPLAILFLAYRTYAEHRKEHEHLTFLYNSTQTLHGTADRDSALVGFLEHLRRALHVEIAAVIIRKPFADQRAIASDAETHPLIPVQLPHDGMLISVMGHPAALIARAGDDADLAALVDGSRDGIAVRIPSDHGPLGALVVANARSEVQRVGAEQVALVEAAAGQLAVWLENDVLEESVARLTELKERLRHQALHDPLTGLANRTLLTEQIKYALAGAERRGDHVAVLFIDLDDFKTINDGLGHDAGDLALTAVADRIRSCSRSSEFTARLGGDEFAVLLDRATEADARRVAERILGALEAPLPAGDRDISVSASIGVALSRPGESQVDLLRNADVAMYMAKAQGKGRVETFEPRMHTAALARLEMMASLRDALARREFVLAFQPIVELASEEIWACEALVRWDHPTRGTLLPDEFIPLAEESGLIVEIGRWVIGEACKQAAAWDAIAPRPISLSVNVCAREIADGELVSSVERALAASGLDPGRLILEITEGSMMRDPDATIEVLDALRALGVRIAIDDFGTGYSSLSYLRRFPVDLVKLDGAFVESVGNGSPQDVEFLRLLIQLTESIGVDTITEGIERAEQKEELRRIGCRFGQGYLYHAPAPAGSIRFVPDAPENVAVRHPRLEVAPVALPLRSPS